MEKILFDAHAHINEERFSEIDRNKIAKEIEKSQVAYVIDAAFNIRSSRQAISDAEKYPWCYAIVGIHPHDSKELDEMHFRSFVKCQDTRRLRGLAK
mgnify:CR=1 FL=1